MEPALSECRPPWVVVTRADDPWVAAELARLWLDADGIPHDLWSPFPLHFVFAPGAAFGVDVSVALTDGRLLATHTIPDRPGDEPP